MERVLAARFYFWLLLIHIATFWQQTPWSFFAGLVKWPYYFVLGIVQKEQRVFVSAALFDYCEGVSRGYLLEPPKFLMRRLLAVAGD